MSDTKHYFEVTQGSTHKVFGPYPTIQAARKASFFYREPNALYHAQKASPGNRNAGRIAFATCGYQDEELACFAADPEAFGHKKVIVKAVAPMHAAWKKAPYDAEFRASYFADSYRQLFGESFGD
jgi:hypothetical protein